MKNQIKEIINKKNIGNMTEDEIINIAEKYFYNYNGTLEACVDLAIKIINDKKHPLKP